MSTLPDDGHAHPVTKPLVADTSSHCQFSALTIARSPLKAFHQNLTVSTVFSELMPEPQHKTGHPLRVAFGSQLSPTTGRKGSPAGGQLQRVTSNNELSALPISGIYGMPGLPPPIPSQEHYDACDAYSAFPMGGSAEANSGGVRASRVRLLQVPHYVIVADLRSASLRSVPQAQAQMRQNSTLREMQAQGN